jgi:hypothetical protein
MGSQPLQGARDCAARLIAAEQVVYLGSCHSSFSRLP